MAKMEWDEMFRAAGRLPRHLAPSATAAALMSRVRSRA